MGTHYCHLKLDERRKLAKWLEAKMPISEIADRLGRDPSTIYRDIKRNRYTDNELLELNGYHALVAQDKYEQRRAIHRKMIIDPDLKAAIENRLKAGWSPEQIAGRMRLERHPIRVSHETIYRFAYSKDGREEQFYRHLPEHRRRRRLRGYRRHNRTHIFDIQSLSHRPERVSERLEFGHWECDWWCNFRSGNSFDAGAMSFCRGAPRQKLPILVFHGSANSSWRRTNGRATGYNG